MQRQGRSAAGPAKDFAGGRKEAVRQHGVDSSMLWRGVRRNHRKAPYFLYGSTDDSAAPRSAALRGKGEVRAVPQGTYIASPIGPKTRTFGLAFGTLQRTRAVARLRVSAGREQAKRAGGRVSEGGMDTSL